MKGVGVIGNQREIRENYQLEELKKKYKIAIQSLINKENKSKNNDALKK